MRVTAEVGVWRSTREMVNGPRRLPIFKVSLDQAKPPTSSPNCTPWEITASSRAQPSEALDSLSQSVDEKRAVTIAKSAIYEGLCWLAAVACLPREWWPREGKTEPLHVRL